MFIDSLLTNFELYREREAMIWQGRSYSYAWLREAVGKWSGRLVTEMIAPGAVIALEADFSPQAVAILLALIERGCVIVPLTNSVRAKRSEFLEIAEVEMVISLEGEEEAIFAPGGAKMQNQLLLNIREKGHPGLVLFSSGSTGKSKAALHDFLPLLEKFKVPRHAKRTISFLLFDHIGGVNTLLYALANGGCVITLSERSPDCVCSAIEKYRAELLPTSPTFLNLILLSEAYQRYDLSSLELVTYGTEVMPESTLLRFHDLFPQVRLQQTYGLSEVGILRSKSRDSSSLWVKVGGEGFETRIKDGLLEIKAQSAMLGYLNAPSPFTADGWFVTGDAVEVDGEYLRILGRKSELINVGGEKVYPAEVESTLLTMDAVEDVSVVGEPNPITGQIVKAYVKLSVEEKASDFRKRMLRHCKDLLPLYKIPQKVVLVDEKMHGERYKKMRAR